jgi:hypothetical protein
MTDSTGMTAEGLVYSESLRVIELWVSRTRRTPRQIAQALGLQERLVRDVIEIYQNGVVRARPQRTPRRNARNRAIQSRQAEAQDGDAGWMGNTSSRDQATHGNNARPTETANVPDLAQVPFPSTVQNEQDGVPSSTRDGPGVASEQTFSSSEQAQVRRRGFLMAFERRQNQGVDTVDLTGKKIAQRASQEPDIGGQGNGRNQQPHTPLGGIHEDDGEESSSIVVIDLTGDEED